MSDYLKYGGQAVVEGVMMRSPSHFAVACRKPDGDIVVREEPIASSILGRLAWLNRPLLRGTLALVDALSLGMKALSFAASVQTDPPPEQATASRSSAPRVQDIAIGSTIVVAFFLGMFLFVMLPTLATQAVQSGLGISSGVGRNLTDGAMRMIVFLTYIWCISWMANIRRVFQYHGAEHKVINTLEVGGALTLESCSAASRIHPRCGTSFVIIVFMASVIVHSVFPRPDHAIVRIALHLALLPLVAGIAYEAIKLAGRFRNGVALNALLAPGLWMQRLTTREPASDQIEVALVALRAVLDRERGADAPASTAAAA